MLELGLAGLLWKILALLWFLGLWSFQGFGVLEACRSWVRVCGFRFSIVGLGVVGFQGFGVLDSCRSWVRVCGFRFSIVGLGVVGFQGILGQPYRESSRPCPYDPLYLTRTPDLALMYNWDPTRPPKS